MAVSLVVGTNTYITLAACETYLEGSINTTSWDAASDDEKNRFLVSATRMIDRQEWVGEKVVASQALDWHFRSGVTDQDGNEVADDAVPGFIEDGTCELANAFASDSSIQESADTGDNTKSLKAGSASIEFFATEISGTKFPTIIQELLGFYLEGADISDANYFGNTDATSEFDPHDLTRGL